MSNPFCHVELMTSDVSGALEFYKGLFGWKINAAPGPMPYHFIDTGKEPEGGVMGLPEPGVPVTWMVYIQVDDLEASVSKVKELGGNVLKDIMEIPDYGWMAVVSDPQGGVFGLWKPKE